MPNRLPTIFALLAIAVLAFGKLIDVWMGASGIFLAFPDRASFDFPIPPYYFVAGWFLLCALLYVLVTAPRRAGLTLWHFWLSAIGSATSLLGLASITLQFRSHAGAPDSASKLLIASFVAWGLAGPALIILGQTFLPAAFLLRARKPLPAESAPSAI